MHTCTCRLIVFLISVAVLETVASLQCSSRWSALQGSAVTLCFPFWTPTEAIKSLKKSAWRALAWDDLYQTEPIVVNGMILRMRTQWPPQICRRVTWCRDSLLLFLQSMHCGSFKAPVTLDLPTLVFRATFDPAGTDVTIAQSPILPLALARTIEGG